MVLYSDRASWAFHTPKAGGKVNKSNLTQVGRALERLGVEYISAYSPQARGLGGVVKEPLERLRIGLSTRDDWATAAKRVPLDER